MEVKLLIANFTPVEHGSRGLFRASDDDLCPIVTRLALSVGTQPTGYYSCWGRLKICDL